MNMIDLKNPSIVKKLGHREPTTIGTGRSLNSSEVTCLDYCSSEYKQNPDNHDGGLKKTDTGAKIYIATGWSDGYIRVFDVSNKETPIYKVNSLLNDDDNNENLTTEPLCLNGHNGNTVRIVKFDTHNNGRLASAGTNGDIVIWDIIAETGLFRLLGHKGAITSLSFFNISGDEKIDGLVSSGMDGLVKIWDLVGQCCMQTLTGHRSEVWTADCMKLRDNRWRLITGASDAQLRVWSLEWDEEVSASNSQSSIATYIGSINRQTTSERAELIKFHPRGNVVGVLSQNSKNVEVYSIRSESESKKRRNRRLRRRREKEGKSIQVLKTDVAKKGILDDDDDDDDGISDNEDDKIQLLLEDGLPVDTVKASDELELLGVVRCVHRVKGFAFARGKAIRLAVASATNVVEVHSFVRDEGFSLSSTFDMYGHVTGIRSIALSSDDALSCTISKGAAKIWNVSTRSCIRALPLTKSDKKMKATALYALCCAFLPGNAHVVVGTKEGVLLLFDYASGDVIFSDEESHNGAIWSLDIRSDGGGLVTGGADHLVKFWEFEGNDGGKPSLIHTRTLKMSDDVVAVRYSYSQDTSKRLVAVSSLDSTIKIFFDDSLKFFLSLYGHKLPALAVDCSDDDVLLASAGADKTIKIWGLDFGDTHRTLHGHTDSITDLCFVRRTHNFFTASKDKTVRYWDADKFEQILLLTGHIAEVNCLAMSRAGGFVLSGGMDRQVRVWERTQDIVFLEEEKERELEKLFDKVDGSRGEQGMGQDDDDAGDRDAAPQSDAAVRKSVVSVAAGDRVAEAIELADQELFEINSFRKNKGRDGDKRTPNPLLLGMEPPLYMLWVLRTVKSAELEQSLLVLPSGHIERLVYYLVVLLRRGIGSELCAKAAIFLIKTHENQVSTLFTRVCDAQ